MSTLVTYERDGAAARLILDSPHNRNALSTALVEQLHDGLTRATADQGVRTVILGHTGGTFCAGADLSEAPQSGGSASPSDVAV
ncbi:enoyl-CoA hydratase, partial [Mycobacterium sp. ITM-2017-0098]